MGNVAHRGLGALDLGLDIVSESEVFLRIVDKARNLQIRLCREHRIDEHVFDRLGYRFSISIPNWRNILITDRFCGCICACAN